MRSIFLIMVGVLVIGVSHAGHNESSYGATPPVRQYYSRWQYHPERQFYFCSYCYKTYDTEHGYRYHYCIVSPSHPNYVYYYNPIERVYWGRYDSLSGGFSLLDPVHRRGTIAAIPESAFNQPGPMPAIPDSRDSRAMLPVEASQLPPMPQNSAAPPPSPTNSAPMSPVSPIPAPVPSTRPDQIIPGGTVG